MARKGKLGKKATKETIKRQKRLRRYKYFFLIVCEDQKTEPEYFQQFVALFPDDTLYLKPVGTGSFPLGVVNQAIIEKAQLQEEYKKEFDAIWVVFDKDDADLNDTTRRNFDEAFKIAKQNKFQIAYSNEAFELWFLLHLEEVPAHSPIPRSDIYIRLEKLIRQNPSESNFVYDHYHTKNTKIVQKINQFGNESKAIERAEIILQAQNGVPPIQANPSTKVHLLVQELRKWIQFCSG